MHFLIHLEFCQAVNFKGGGCVRRPLTVCNVMCYASLVLAAVNRSYQFGGSDRTGFIQSSS